MNKVIVCDLDGTLAESKQNLDVSMAEIISQVLDKFRLVVISGASYRQFKTQFLANLNLPVEKFKNLYLFPANGSSFYIYDQNSGWSAVYEEFLTEADKEVIYNAFGKAIEKSGVDIFDSNGPVNILEDRGGQITFSGRGQDAPLEIKESWDPKGEKRAKIVSVLKELLPDFEIRIGGATSIDVTGKGIDKAYAISKIEQYMKVGKEDIIYIGDALFEGGNDEAALKTGVTCIKVSGPEETKRELLKIIES